MLKRFFVIPLLAVAQLAHADDPVEFGRDILPILSETCLHCHGPDENTREADLRLDTAEGARRDLGGYAAIVAGKPDESELIRRVESTDPGEMMPPPDSKLSISDHDRERLRKWIEQGGEYE